MALKDWKKIEDRNYWYKKNKDISVNKIPHSTKFRVQITTNWRNGMGFTKTYNAKSQALKYAKDYMKKH